MYYANNQLLFSPSDLMVYFESEFASWMERLALEDTEVVKERDKEDELLQSVQSKGIAHEQKYLDKLRDDGLTIVEIEESINKDERRELTIQSMQNGVDVIYQAYLALTPFAGLADFLVKVPGKSKLGDYHYEAWDTKLSKKTKPYFAIQLCCYSEMVKEIQGVMPKYIAVVLGNCEQRRLRTNDLFYYYKGLKESFVQFQQDFDKTRMPDPSLSNSYGRWINKAETILKEKDHLCFVANIKRSQIKKLEKAGITTLSKLASTRLKRAPKMGDNVFERLKYQAQLQKSSEGKDIPDYEVIPPSDDAPHIGLAMLPPLSDYDVYFDMEGYPLIEGGLEYLFGNCYVEDGKTLFVDWWAHDRQQEKEAFEGFVDWAFARWKDDRNMHIYHYGHYEVTAIRRLSCAHGTREHEVDELLRNEVFVDLYAIIRNGVRIGEPGYSIKNVEHIYRGKREGDVTDAGTSVAYYEQWMEEPDGVDWRSSKILKDIRDYNEDDCESTLECTEWLRKLQRTNNIEWVGNCDEPQDIEEDDERVTEITELRDALLANEDDEVSQTLAWLLEFHRRENKPVLWRMFDRMDQDDEDLVDDLDCLGNLVKTAKPPETVKRSLCYQYSFDPNQDTKLSKGSRCMSARDPKLKLELYDLDTNRGLAYIKVGKNKELPSVMSLIPDEYVGPGPIPGAIIDYAKDWLEGKSTLKAVDDFLCRRRPDIKGNPEGNIVFAENDNMDEIISSVKNMQETCLCIQGPPGAGKTFTASHVILELLKTGKRIGITSNSHKAINNLIKATVKLMDNSNCHFQTAKLQREKDDQIFANDIVKHIASMGSCDPFPENIFLFGGTAWSFSHENAIGKFDYLFIDEAGQVSIANLVGMGRSTDNIVLLGDQMQLGQPIQGSHPGESGKSILDYLLQNHATIPSDLGIFLATTWRMHPNLCSFISSAVYENRLHPEEHTVNQVIKFPKNSKSLIKQESGLVFIPVEHEGNVQASDEEVEVIVQLVNDLTKVEYINVKGKNCGKPGFDEILFIAPYNYQVRKLQSALGSDARVGSVDKFQGQEAQVVIISMCASQADDSGRGIKFIFNKNRLNVAISRAKCLAVVVGNPGLAKSTVNSVEQMELVNLYSRVILHTSLLP